MRLVVCCCVCALFLCHAAPPVLAAEPLSIDAELSIPGWWVVGPFLSGSREAGTDALAMAPGVDTWDEELLAPSYPSLLVPGAEARWRFYSADENGRVEVDYPEVPQESMDLVTDEWGFAGQMTVGYARATVTLTDGPRRALVDIRNSGGFELNGLPYPGDPYGYGWAPVPVVLEQGDNELKLAVSRDNFTFRLLPVESDVQVLSGSATRPDLVAGETLPVLLGLAVINNTTEWLEVEGAAVSGSALYSGAVVNDIAGDGQPLRIAPLALQTLALTLEPAVDAVPEGLGETAELDLRLRLGGKEYPATITLDVRQPEQARRVTFTSKMDNSVQYYGMLPPKDYDPARDYALILSLHGAGVEAIGQAQAYQPKDYAFVIAPTNRRPYGFDWQDWGRLDMLEVLDEALNNYPIDDDRVHLTGHSMGGHGTWINALTYPDKWASACPSAGWSTFDLYVPFFLRRNQLLGDPRANLIHELAMREEDTLFLAENGINLPFFALEGGADDNVPPQQPRLMVQTLRQFGCDVQYREVPGMGHWWGFEGTGRTECVDNEWFEDLWKNAKRNRWPKKVVFKTHNISISDGAYWVKEVRPTDAGTDCIVRAEVLDNRTISLNTSNVSDVSLEISPALVVPGEFTIVLNGNRTEYNTHNWEDFGGPVTPRITLHVSSWPFSSGYPINSSYDYNPIPAKSQQRYGPWKQALMQPFDVVYGTRDSAEQTEFFEALARLYTWTWWYRGNGACRIISDIDCNQSSFRNRVLLGGPLSNSISAEISSELDNPMREMMNRWSGGTMISPLIKWLLSRESAETDQTCKFVYPNPVDGGRSLILMEMGSSMDALKRLPAAIGIYAGAGFPDYMVWDNNYDLQGMGGPLRSGLFNMSWSGSSVEFVSPEVQPLPVYWN